MKNQTKLLLRTDLPEDDGGDDGDGVGDVFSAVKQTTKREEMNSQ